VRLGKRINILGDFDNDSYNEDTALEIRMFLKYYLAGIFYYEQFL
jgi:hypothetical protein